MDYPAVKRAHIIAQTYLRNFADGEKIALRLKGRNDAMQSTVEKVGVRNTFYRRTRLDGTPIDDVEHSLSVLEGEVTPALRAIEDRWPLSDGDKTALAEFFAAQYVRGPRWRRHHEEFLDQEVQSWRAGDLLEGFSRAPSEAEIAATAEHLGSDTQMLVQMLSLIPKVQTLLGSMHWTLIRFDGRALALSDDPVVPWPLEGARVPQASRYENGLLPTLEWLIPVSSRCALLLTWIDDEDVAAPVRGALHHAKTLNAFTVAQADRQWFHHPDSRPRLHSGKLVPLSFEIHDGYSTKVAYDSMRRAKVSEMLNAKLGSRLDTEAAIITVKRNALDGRTALVS